MGAGTEAPPTNGVENYVLYQPVRCKGFSWAPMGADLSPTIIMFVP